MISTLEPGAKQMEGKGKDDQRNEYCQRFDIYKPAKLLWFSYMEEIV